MVVLSHNALKTAGLRSPNNVPSEKRPSNTLDNRLRLSLISQAMRQSQLIESYNIGITQIKKLKNSKLMLNSQ